MQLSCCERGCRAVGKGDCRCTLEQFLPPKHVNLSSNDLSDFSIIDAVAIHSCMAYFDFSNNGIENISIETQLILSKRLESMEMDLSLNPLSSPLLGRLTNHSNLQSCLELLSKERRQLQELDSWY